MITMTVNDVAPLLPAPDVLRDHCRALAVLDAILCPEWPDRYFSFDAAWAPTEQLATMRNGSGDEYTVTFTPAGAYLRGFDHESPMSPYAEDRVWPGILEDVPSPLRACAEEPAFTDDDIPTVTAALWRLVTDDHWHTGTIDFPPGHPDPDGADWLFRSLTDRSAEAYVEFATDYYEMPVDPAAVRHILGLRPLTTEVIRTLNPDLTLADLTDDLAEIGYP